MNNTNQTGFMNKLFNAMSAYQKSVRRGLLEDSLYWGTELFLLNSGSFWNRTRIIASEDCGGNSILVSCIRSLYENSKDGKEVELYVINAIITLTIYPRTLTKKSRLIDYALIKYFKGNRGIKRIPDYAKDMHTKEGKILGRGVRHFFDEASKIVEFDGDLNEYEKKWREEAKKILLKLDKTEIKQNGLF